MKNFNTLRTVTSLILIASFLLFLVSCDTVFPAETKEPHITDESGSITTEVSQTIEETTSPSDDTTTAPEIVIYEYDNTWQISYDDLKDQGEDIPYVGDGKHIIMATTISSTFIIDFGMGLNGTHEADLSRFIRLHCPGANDTYLDEKDIRDYNTSYMTLYYALEYFSIPKEDYVKWIESVKGWYSKSDFWNTYFSVEGDKNPPPNADFEVAALYSEHPENSERFIYKDFKYDGIDTVVKRPDNETEKKYISLYYTIDYRLIAYVGEEKFNSFKDKYYGTEDFNILKFIEEFNIDKEKMIWINENYFYPKYVYKDGVNKIYSYNPDYLYGTDEMKEEYFSIHPLEYNIDEIVQGYANKD